MTLHVERTMTGGKPLNCLVLFLYRPIVPLGTAAIVHQNCPNWLCRGFGNHNVIILLILKFGNYPYDVDAASG